MEIFKKLEWKHVASLSQSGNKYSEYINTLQDFLSKSENGGMTFIANRKFDPSKNMKKVIKFSFMRAVHSVLLVK